MGLSIKLFNNLIYNEKYLGSERRFLLNCLSVLYNCIRQDIQLYNALNRQKRGYLKAAMVLLPEHCVKHPACLPVATSLLFFELMKTSLSVDTITKIIYEELHMISKPRVLTGLIFLDNG